VLRWGLVPHWSKALSIGTKLINARVEGIDTKPPFRDAFRQRRCLIPASGFYEWKTTPGGKQPFAIVPRDEPLFAFAGLWENWRDKAAGEGAEWIRSCTIITGAPNDLCAPIHDRMPVILPSHAWPRWLGEEESASGELLALLKPYPASHMRAYPIGARVGAVKNDDESLLEPAATA